MNSAFGDIWHMCGSQLSFKGKFGQNLELVEVSHGLNRDLWQGECVAQTLTRQCRVQGPHFATMGDGNATCTVHSAPLPPNCHCEGWPER